MADAPKAPAEKSEPSAFEKMKDFTRRLIAVPKSEIPVQKPKKLKRKNSGY
jgi:hypothetical protein